ncbi:EF-P lysine aminoacylase GenX [Candidatus Uhrbacteria bacterium]|nr:EF-P lysine aminoacylase GenX [Candidatus Uhrbacteria bacterium]
MLSFDDLRRRLSLWQTTEQQIHAFFQARGFVHVRTPMLVRSPGMEPHLDPLTTRLHLMHPERTQDAGFITSPEYSMKKLLGAGMKKIYTITPVFRDGEALGPHNWPEFTLLEWYAPGGYAELMNETEDLLKFVLDDQTPWPHLTYAAAQVDAFGQPHTEHNRFFVTQYPPEQAALARLSEDGRTAERFEAFGDGLELCNGFCELTDAQEQRRRFELEQAERRAMGKRVFPLDEELLSALEKIEGPVYGNALGLDRLIMLKYAIADIRDIQILNTLT